MNKQNMNKVIRVRISVADWDEINEKSRLCGLALSAFVRSCATGRRVTPVTDEKTAWEIRRLGRMIKHLYPRVANWSTAEKRAYWDAMKELFDIANKLDGRDKVVGEFAE
jgi:predicted nucleic acid-binding Zn ribbon protein